MITRRLFCGCVAAGFSFAATAVHAQSQDCAVFTPDRQKATTPDDSLLLISFGVPTARGGMVPLTLGIRFQRAGAGFASEVAPHFIAVIRDYFAAGQRRLP